MFHREHSRVTLTDIVERSNSYSASLGISSEVRFLGQIDNESPYEQ